MALAFRKIARTSIARSSLAFAPRTTRVTAAFVVLAAMSGSASAATPKELKNVLGGPLKCCCTSPVTGYYRDGFCQTDASDHGKHVICAQVTEQWLQFSRSRGNDLMTPRGSFPGLKDGDKWCLCASRWKEALDAGVAPPVFLACTHAKALEYVTLESLQQHALDAESAAADAKASHQEL